MKNLPEGWTCDRIKAVSATDVSMLSLPISCQLHRPSYSEVKPHIPYLLDRYWFSAYS